MLAHRFWSPLALVLAFALVSCSTPDDLAPNAGLTPQFGTRGFDSVFAVSYGKAKKLYAAGVLGSDAYLRRYDSSGNMIWERYLDAGAPYNAWSSQSYGLADMVTDGSGNTFVLWGGGFYDEEDTGDSFSASYLSKYDINGARKFQVVVRGVGELSTDTSGNVYGIFGDYPSMYLTKYTTSGTKSWEKLVSATEDLTVSSANSVYTLRSNGFAYKYNSSGTQLWAKKLVVGNDEATFDESECPFGYCFANSAYEIVGGLSDDLMVMGGRTLSSGDGDQCGETWQSLTLTRFDKNGTRVVAKNSSDLYSSSCNGYEGEEDYGWTDFDITTDTLGNTYLATGRNNDGSVTKFNRSGTQTWSKGFGTSRRDVANSVAVYDGSEVFVGGQTNGFLVHRNLGSWDALLRKMDVNGNQVWTR